MRRRDCGLRRNRCGRRSLKEQAAPADASRAEEPTAAGETKAESHAAPAKGLPVADAALYTAVTMAVIVATALSVRRAIKI